MREADKEDEDEDEEDEDAVRDELEGMFNPCRTSLLGAYKRI